MITIDRILFPTDFSDCAQQALDHALFWARRYDADLDVLHVLEEDRGAGALSESEARSAIRLALGAREAHDWPGRRAVTSAADVPEAILSRAASDDVDLIVMGTHGRTPYGAMLMGSVAEEVSRRAPCPVLTVRQRARPAIPGPIERILVPIDLSSRSCLGIRYARELAAEDGATIVLLHVDESGEHAARELMELYDAATGPDACMEAHVLRGLPPEEIAGYAAQEGAGLIVMPSRGAPSRMPVLGSVTAKVVSRAPCPVLVLPPPGRRLFEERTPAVARAMDEIC